MNLGKKVSLKNNEKVVFVFRRYGLTFFWEFLLVVFLFTVPFFFMFWLFNNGWWGVALFSLFIAFGLLVLARILFLWKKNILVLTTHRLVDFDQRSFFYQIVSDVPYDQVENVHGKVKGLWQTMFGYGDVNIQTGQGQICLTVDRVKYPLTVAQEINKLREFYLTHLVHHFSGNLAEAVIDKLYELEVEDLERIKIVVEKRLKKLKD